MRPVVSTIRKLLRLAKYGTDHEAALAHSAAHELMEKHAVIVSLDDLDEHKEVVRGVAGVFWREQLLTNIGRVYECRVLRETRALKDRPKGPRVGVAVIAGDRGDVMKAKDRFEFAAFKITMECQFSWERWWKSNKRALLTVEDLPIGGGDYLSREDIEDLANDRPRRNRIEDYDPYGGSMNAFVGEMEANGFLSRMYKVLGRETSTTRKNMRPLSETKDEASAAKASAARESLCKSVWFDWYHTSAVAGITEALSPVVKKKSTFAPPPVDVPDRDDQTAADKLVGAVETLGRETTEDFARSLQSAAEKRGKSLAKSGEWGRALRLALTSACSFLPPPPEPSRFNQLDLDDVVEKKVKKEKKKKGRDIEI